MKLYERLSLEIYFYSPGYKEMKIQEFPLFSCLLMVDYSCVFVNLSPCDGRMYSFFKPITLHHQGFGSRQSKIKLMKTGSRPLAGNPNILFADKFWMGSCHIQYRLIRLYRLYFAIQYNLLEMEVINSNQISPLFVTGFSFNPNYNCINS